MPRPSLVGREQELAAIERFLDRASDASATALVIEGEAGIGKTALWQEAVRRAQERGFQLLRSRPSEAEEELSYAALADLLRPVEGIFGELPAPQRRALRVALLDEEAGGSPVEARAVAAGLRTVLARLAESAEVLVAVDDLQWLDSESATALAFALRRLDGERVAFLAAERSPQRSGARRFQLEGVERLELGSLTVAAVHELVKERLGRSPPRPQLVRLHAACGGNPLFALEVAREILEREVRPGDPLPLPKDLRRLLERRLRRLSPPARELLLAAALVAHPTRRRLEGACERNLSSALLEIEDAEVGRIAGGRFEFSHPLYAAAVTAAAPRERRRRLHARLAELADDAEERAYQLALAADPPDAPVAAALEHAAARARSRGAPAAAAELTELALGFRAAEDPAREQTGVELVELLALSGDTKRAWELAGEQLSRLSSPALRVRALLVLAELAAWTRDWATDDEHPVRLSERALEAAGNDPGLRARCHAWLAARHETEPLLCAQHAGEALRLIEAGAAVDRATHALALVQATQARLFSGHGLDRAQMRCAIALELGAEPPAVADTARYDLAKWLKYVDDFDGSRAGLEAARVEATERGDDLSLLNVLTNLIVLESWAGNWLLALEHGRRLEQLSRELETDTGMHHLAYPAALLGDDATLRAVDAPGVGAYDVIRLRALGALALSQADAQTAHSYLGRALELLRQAGILEPAVFRVHADAVESAASSGAIDDAAEATRELERAADSSGIPWDAMAAARGRALVASARGQLEDALVHAERALALADAVPMPLERARTLLAKGQIERRLRRKAAARRSLEAAVAGFVELGARLWAERAREEVARLGLRHVAPGELTESERRVVELAASGLKNREVAAQLFMSPKTVEANLARAYRKLGIRSRAELGARLGEERASAQT